MYAPNNHRLPYSNRFNSPVHNPIHRRALGGSRELLPWADPYIARLVQKLKAEIHEERQLGRCEVIEEEVIEEETLADELYFAEAQPPFVDEEEDFLPYDREQWFDERYCD